ncbi:hydrogenase maturation nickel metallochaperone HypA [Methanonatronarchaeum sp. AMET6-2]|uniref:hydrogenase maturation nickel metallochaperone HypA n=1 Tax=Methanonatronarchaeum sp. AMET6-2 TaxID=2933293 RepID=UPI001203AD82|nr:hydrogenase maturation nickel metallochaperone HypA [Methanonatronarchaeum sp. AMET6-2]RZN62267.1 MAG: hypothetical protein EF811_03435 [Methanonatronarchaeia archaeon]UOY10395.1 hydrogenase maturation nickel metallochaperone HypA [Methanonatronarchaeum sp. AMET6-2]
MKKTNKLKKENQLQTNVEFICDNCNHTYQKDLIKSSEIKCPECQSLKLFYSDNNKKTRLNRIQRKIKDIFKKT